MEFAERSGDLAAGPVDPQGNTRLRPLPLSGLTLDAAGWWGDQQARNRAITLPYGLEALETAGNIDNFRRVLGESDAGYRGFNFNDSDLYKSLEAAAWTMFQVDAPELRDYLKSVTELLSRVQLADGYLNSFVQGEEGRRRFSDLAESHELYTAGHLFQAAVAHFRVTGERDLLEVAVRFADQLVAEFGDGRRQDYDGHPEVETALVELFRTTGNRSYLELARQFILNRGARIFPEDRRGHAYFQDARPVLEETSIVGHAVRAMYLEAGVVDVAVETGDQALLNSSLVRWNDLVTSKLYITGGTGSRHKTESFGDPYELPPDRAYCETCAAIASIHWNWRLLLATGEGRYADLLERTVYNGFAAGTGLDGMSFFYSNPLQLREDHQGSAEEEAGKRLSWYGCACCPPNIMRLLASLQHYVATTDDAGVQLHQYTECTVDLRQSGRDVVLNVSTRYPWDGDIVITLAQCADPEWQLSLRVPPWAVDVSVTYNGLPVDPTSDSGYLRLQGPWAAGDIVRLELGMPARFTVANPQVDAVRGCAVIERGPLVYCLEAADNPDVDLASVYLDTAQPLTLVDIESWPEVRGVIAGAVSVIEHQATPLYGAATEDHAALPTRVTAIPYYLWANRALGPMRVWLPLTANRPTG